MGWPPPHCALQRPCLRAQHDSGMPPPAGNPNVLVCERGTMFGYSDLVVDPRNLVLMRDAGCPVTCDVTHALQQPAGRPLEVWAEPVVLWMMLPRPLDHSHDARAGRRCGQRRAAGAHSHHRAHGGGMRRGRAVHGGMLACRAHIRVCSAHATDPHGLGARCMTTRSPPQWMVQRSGPCGTLRSCWWS